MRIRNVKAMGKMLQRRALTLLALATVLALASLGAVPVGAALLLDEPMPAWAGGVDEAIADEGDASNSNTASDGSTGSGKSAGTTQAAAGTSDSNSAGTAGTSSASASSAASANRPSSGGSADDRGYVGPWYALNSDYVVQVEERFDAITEDEYATSVARNALAIGGGIAALLAIIMFVRAHKVQSKVRKRRR